MLKEYEYDGATWQFEEDRAPEGAVLLTREADKAPIDEPTEDELTVAEGVSIDTADEDDAVDGCQTKEPADEKAVKPVNKSRSVSDKGSE